MLCSDKLYQCDKVSKISEPNLTEHFNSPMTLRNETPILISDDADHEAETRGYGPMFSPKEPSLGTPRIRLKTAASPTLPCTPVYRSFASEVTVSAPPNFGTKGSGGRGKRTSQSTPRKKSQSSSRTATPRTATPKTATPRKKYQPPLPRRQTRAMMKRRKLMDDTWNEFEVVFSDDA